MWESLTGICSYAVVFFDMAYHRVAYRDIVGVRAAETQNPITLPFPFVQLLRRDVAELLPQFQCRRAVAFHLCALGFKPTGSMQQR